MSLKSGIFNSTTVTATETGLLRGDKAVDAAFLAKMFSSFFRTGLVTGKDSTSFASSVTNGTMEVVTRPGACHIEGYFAYDNASETRTFAVSQSDRCAARILRLDLNDGSIRVLWRDCIRQGSLLISTEDSARLPIRSGGIYDLVTCVVDIPAGTQALTSDMLTDLRADGNYCGFCTAY
ncbi:MAG: hypothetical protein IKZ09_01085 [Clostridia bacterium]|nr:hypothetical protein [Clostridia bacterium]